MAYREVVEATEKGEGTGAKDLRTVLTAKISGVLPKLRGLQLKRRRGAKWPALPRKLEVEWSEGSIEDREVHAAELADWMLARANEDAGEKRTQYQFIGLAEAAPGKDPGELFNVEHTIAPGEDDDDGPTTRAGETTFLLKAARELVTGVSGEFVKVLKETNNLIKSNADTSKALGEALSNSDGKRWEVESKRLDMQFHADLFGAQALLNRERSINFHNTVREGIKTVGPILEILAELVADQPVNNPPPTEAEVKTLFGSHPTMLKLALEYIAETDAEKKRNLAAGFAFEWASLDQNAQAAIIMHAKKELGTMRMAKLAAWVKRMIAEAEEKK